MPLPLCCNPGITGTVTLTRVCVAPLPANTRLATLTPNTSDSPDTSKEEFATATTWVIELRDASVPDELYCSVTWKGSGGTGAGEESGLLSALTPDFAMVSLLSVPFSPLRRVAPASRSPRNEGGPMSRCAGEVRLATWKNSSAPKTVSPAWLPTLIL